MQKIEIDGATSGLERIEVYCTKGACKQLMHALSVPDFLPSLAWRKRMLVMWACTLAERK
jgi:hypothetical protein